jgi:dipeptidyl aminopeptidase/acylaminoacyl peptidase
LTYVSRDDPPLLIEHGSEDCVVPPGQSVLLRDALSPLLKRNLVWFSILEGAGHGGRAFSSEENLGLVLRFLDRYVKQ